ncbi:hypothetical protein [Gloeomargarita sp.]
MGKPIGEYLVEAGLLEQSQVDLALAEQRRTGKRFGDIIVAHGWLQRQTIEYWMKNVIIPHRQLTTPPQPAASPNQRRPRKPPEETLVIGWEQTSVPPQTPPSNPPQPKDIHHQETLILEYKDLPPLG